MYSYTVRERNSIHFLGFITLIFCQAYVFCYTYLYRLLLVCFFLTGSEEMSPWGLIQNLPCIRRKVRFALYDSLSNYGKSEKNQQDDSDIDNPNIPFLDPVLSKNFSVEQLI